MGQENQYNSFFMKDCDTNSTITNSFAYGYTNKIHTFQIKATNITNQAVEYYLQLNEPFMEIVDFHFDNATYHTGINTDVLMRRIQNPLPTILIQFSPNETKDITIELMSRFGTFGKLAFYNHEAYHQHELDYTTLFMLYFGAIGVMFLYNFFLFLSLRDKSYLYYILYVLIFGGWVFLYSGKSLHFITSQVYYMLHFTTPLAFVFFASFSQMILQTKEFFPKIHILINFHIFVLIFLSFITIFNLEIGYKVANIYGFFLFSTLIITAIMGINKESQTAKFYLIALVFFIVTMLLVSLLAIGYIEYSFWGKYSFLGGSLVEITLFSFMLANRINRLKQEKLELQIDESKRLEKMVNEKTQTLVNMVEEREILLKEIHHRVKNNLQIINGLLGIQALKAFHEETKNMLSDSMSRIRSIALVHEYLYLKSNLRNIDTQEYIEKLIEAISVGLVDGVEIETNIKEVAIDLDTASNLGLIISEVILNGLKHGFPVTQIDKKIVITLDSSKNKQCLIIKDNGVGFDGVSKKKDSLGVKIISSLASKLKNSSYKYEKNSGTVFTLEFEIE